MIVIIVLVITAKIGIIVLTGILSIRVLKEIGVTRATRK